jgi:hypothetical protein
VSAGRGIYNIQVRTFHNLLGCCLSCIHIHQRKTWLSLSAVAESVRSVLLIHFTARSYQPAAALAHVCMLCCVFCCEVCCVLWGLLCCVCCAVCFVVCCEVCCVVLCFVVLCCVLLCCMLCVSDICFKHWSPITNECSSVVTFVFN